ncbi:hypothetical protein [Lentilactobacillus kefiri]|uniref:Uncharacterized protein n=2 Tax=Lentilactobacillus kefiri TaxID=33962 RepID=A0A8E1RKG5_LENKE|nr:hypothetical protein [Lentilactobacillus kefiri]KRL72281.1 hypothetical protein FD08_GL004202 [Lentilactobacillus parakefiri DSM 10551]KRM53928.1 hypothetical protein FC95_GL000122 [Lentilactobacillus kefiri DSM 20587 = JCM 5818]MCJ2161339.1 hypothetical protein [Lentilactobacillus kefiri]MCP9368822.1 hypothetical protein [Lentilactobacillus kefiri]PAK59458.1 hypothetical protein B9K02_06280 [Lentilactobacillus kefiri]
MIIRIKRFIIRFGGKILLLSEIEAIKSSKTSRKTIIYTFIMIVVTELLTWQTYFLHSIKGYPHGLPGSQIINPPTAAFLSLNSSGEFLQLIIMLLMPIFLILITLQRKIEISQGKSNYIFQTRMGTVNQYLIKGQITQFVIFTLFYMALFSFDLLVNIVLFHKGTSFKGVENSTINSHLLNLELAHPYLTYIWFIIIVSIAFGIYAVVTYILALSLKKTFLVYPISLGLWIMMFALPYSSSYFMQPFIEFDWKEYGMSMLSYLLICGVVIIVGNWIVRLRSHNSYC